VSSFQDTLGSWYQYVKPFQVLLQQKMEEVPVVTTGKRWKRCQWLQLERDGRGASGYNWNS